MARKSCILIILMPLLTPLFIKKPFLTIAIKKQTTNPIRFKVNKSITKFLFLASMDLVFSAIPVWSSLCSDDLISWPALFFSFLNYDSYIGVKAINKTCSVEFYCENCYGMQYAMCHLYHSYLLKCFRHKFVRPSLYIKTVQATSTIFNL